MGMAGPHGQLASLLFGNEVGEQSKQLTRCMNLIRCHNNTNIRQKLSISTRWDIMYIHNLCIEILWNLKCSVIIDTHTSCEMLLVTWHKSSSRTESDLCPTKQSYQIWMIRLQSQVWNRLFQNRSQSQHCCKSSWSFIVFHGFSLSLFR